MILAASLVLLAYIPLLLIYGDTLWARSHYQFFPFAILGSAVLAVQAWRRHGDQELSGGSLLTVKLLFLVSFGLLLAGMALRSGWFGAISLLIFLAGLVTALGGATLCRAMIPSLLMLLTFMSLPLGLDGDLVLRLRQFAVGISGALLDILRIPHFVFGNTIEIRGHKLLVEEACSGINSVFFVGALSLFYGLWRQRSAWRIVCLLLAGLSFVLLGNVIRIASGVFLKYHYDIDILTGWKHETAGLVIFAVSVGLLLNFDRFMAQFFSLIPSSDAPAPSAAEGPSNGPGLFAIFHQVARALPHRWVIVGAAAFALVATLQGGLMMAQHRSAGLAFKQLPGLKASATFSLPDLMAGWTRTATEKSGPIERESKLGGKPIQSRQWAYQNGRMVVWLSLDYPYSERHDLTVCYKGKGWEFGQPAASEGIGLRATVLEMDMMQKPLKNGYLTFTQFLGDGRWFAGPFGRLMDRVAHGPVYQLQAVVVRTDPLTPQEKQVVRALFEEAKKRLAGQVLAQLEAKT